MGWVGEMGGASEGVAFCTPKLGRVNGYLNQWCWYRSSSRIYPAIAIITPHLFKSSTVITPFFTKSASLYAIPHSSHCNGYSMTSFVFAAAAGVWVAVSRGLDDLLYLFCCWLGFDDWNGGVLKRIALFLERGWSWILVRYASQTTRG